MTALLPHLAALQVVIPLMAAPLCALLRHARAAWALATLACWAALAISVLLLRQSTTTATFSYAMGDWAPPWGVEYVVDPANVLVLLIVSGIAAVVLPFARSSVEDEIEKAKIPLFYAAVLLCVTGMLGISMTGDLFNMFVFLEIMSLSTYSLVAMGRDRRALTAAFRYLVLGSIGATFIVIGIGLLYSMTGSLNMADLARLLPAVEGPRTVPVAFAFLAVGISLKIALFPLHVWLPNAYAYAPSAVSALIAATSTKVAVYMLLRVFFTVFGAEYSFGTMRLHLILLPLALIAIISMSLAAIFQENAKRLLAYSSLAQVGYMTLGISLGNVTGLTAGILHLFNHALMKGALFMALGCVMYRIGSVQIRDMAGLSRQMPWTMAAVAAGGVSLIGVPLTVGFISKWYLVGGALERGWWPVAALVVISSLLAIIYIWRVIESAYFREVPEGREAREAPLGMLIPTWILILASFYFGIDGRLTTRVAGRAAEFLLGAG